jgi:DNA-directed RNA polymerase specialized sigma54-like protein
MKQEIKTVNHSELEENMNTTSESNDLIEENTNNFSDTSTKILSEEETKNTLPTDIIQKMGGTEGDRKEAIELYQKYS